MTGVTARFNQSQHKRDNWVRFCTQNLKPNLVLLIAIQNAEAPSSAVFTPTRVLTSLRWPLPKLPQPSSAVLGKKRDFWRIYTCPVTRISSADRAVTESRCLHFRVFVRVSTKVEKFENLSQELSLITLSTFFVHWIQQQPAIALICNNWHNSPPTRILSLLPTFQSGGYALSLAAQADSHTDTPEHRQIRALKDTILMGEKKTQNLIVVGWWGNVFKGVLCKILFGCS